MRVNDCVLKDDRNVHICFSESSIHHLLLVTAFCIGRHIIRTNLELFFQFGWCKNPLQHWAGRSPAPKVRPCQLLVPFRMLPTESSENVRFRTVAWKQRDSWCNKHIYITSKEEKNKNTQVQHQLRQIPRWWLARGIQRGQRQLCRLFGEPDDRKAACSMPELPLRQLLRQVSLPCSSYCYNSPSLSLFFSIKSFHWGSEKLWQLWGGRNGLRIG